MILVQLCCTNERTSSLSPQVYDEGAEEAGAQCETAQVEEGAARRQGEGGGQEEEAKDEEGRRVRVMMVTLEVVQVLPS